MADVRAERDRKHGKPTNDDYGFYRSKWLARRLYWQRRGSMSPVFAEPGGWLDQDDRLEDDVKTVGWLVDIAEGLLDEDEKIRKMLKDRRGERS